MAEAVAPVPMDELEDEEQPVNYEQVVTDAIVASPNRPTASARIRDFLKSHLLTDADATTDEESQREAAGSPPPNCAICLGKVSSKCFTDSCMHQFCFSCLLEWSKIKAECPLCKQTFKSIIHNVRSMDKYEEYKVEQRRFATFRTIADEFEHILYGHHMISRSYIPRRARHNTSIPPSASTAVGASNYNRFYQLFLNESDLTERFAIEFAGDTIPSRSSGAIWRSYVYQRALYALPLNDVTGRGRDISARFYRENPAQVHRLMPWLNREMMWILSSFMPVSYMMGMMAEFIVTYDITSRAFRNHVSTYFHRYTSHFIHELTNFALSHYDMIGYDMHVQYRPYFEEEVQNLQIITDERNYGPTVIVSVDRYFDRGGPSGSRRSRSRATPSSSATTTTSTSALTSPLDPLIFRPTTIDATTPVNLTSVTIDSASSSDEVVFVREQKPPHLRTPVMVELNSDSDSDVQFVTEQVPVKIEADASCNHPSNSQRTNGGESSADELNELQIKPEVSITSRIKRVGFPRPTATATYAPPPPTCIYSSEDEYTGNVRAASQMPSSPLVARHSPLVDVEGTTNNDVVASSSFHVAERRPSSSSTSSSDVSRPAYRTARKTASKRLRQRESCVSSSSSSSSTSTTSTSSTSPQLANGLDAIPPANDDVECAPALSSSSSSTSLDDSSPSSSDDEHNNLNPINPLHFPGQSFAPAASTSRPLSSSDESSSESSHEEYVVSRQRKRKLTKQKGAKSSASSGAAKLRTMDARFQSARRPVKRTKRSVIVKRNAASLQEAAAASSTDSDASDQLHI